MQVALCVNGVGESLRGLGDNAAAADRFREASRMCRASLGPAHPLLAAALHNLAQVGRHVAQFPLRDVCIVACSQLQSAWPNGDSAGSPRPAVRWK